MGWDDVSRVMSRTPAEIGMLGGYNRPFEIGSPAHLTLVDATARTVFDLEHLRGMSTNSPYLGDTLPGRVVATVHGGVPTVLDGVLREPEEVARG